MLVIGGWTGNLTALISGWKDKTVKNLDEREVLAGLEVFLEGLESAGGHENDVEVIKKTIEFIEGQKDVTQAQYLRSTALTMGIQWTLATAKTGMIGAFPQMLQPTVDMFYDYLHYGTPLDEKAS